MSNGAGGDGQEPTNIIDMDKARELLEDDHWKEGLERRGRMILTHEANVEHALTHSPYFKGKIAFDTRKWRAVQLAQTPAGPAGDWTDRHSVQVAVWLQRQDIPAKPKTVDNALLMASHKNEIDPLADWLRGLEWDGQERIDTWLHVYCGAEDSMANRAMGSKWLIGAVARALKPGCRMDNMLVLEGPQGARKSTLVQILGGEYTAESLPDFHGKDAQLIAGTAWLVEVAELAAIKKSETEAIKSFISRLVDTFRPPYGRYPITQKRRCVFVGNLNPDGSGYLKDTTGNRRFWPVLVGQINIEQLTIDRDQIWAEAVHHFNHGSPWWLDQMEAEDVLPLQQERLQEDTWLSIIAQWAENKVGQITTLDIAQDALGLEAKEHTPAVLTRIGIIMKQLKYLKRRISTENGREWVYSKSDFD